VPESGHTFYAIELVTTVIEGDLSYFSERSSECELLCLQWMVVFPRALKFTKSRDLGDLYTRSYWELFSVRAFGASHWRLPCRLTMSGRKTYAI
jgi:hypothetical protein